MIDTQKNLVLKASENFSNKYGNRGEKTEGTTTIKTLNPYLDAFEEMSNALFGLMDTLNLSPAKHAQEIDALFEYCLDIEVFDIQAITKTLKVYLKRAKNNGEHYLPIINSFFDAINNLTSKPGYNINKMRDILLKDLGVIFPASNQFHCWTPKRCRPNKFYR